MLDLGREKDDEMNQLKLQQKWCSTSPRKSHEGSLAGWLQTPSLGACSLSTSGAHWEYSLFIQWRWWATFKIAFNGHCWFLTNTKATMDFSNIILTLRRLKRRLYIYSMYVLNFLWNNIEKRQKNHFAHEEWYIIWAACPLTQDKSVIWN